MGGGIVKSSFAGTYFCRVQFILLSHHLDKTQYGMVTISSSILVTTYPSSYHEQGAAFSITVCLDVFKGLGGVMV